MSTFLERESLNKFTNTCGGKWQQRISLGDTENTASFKK